eukprot:COSAG06_NODE_390_length_16395_cov_6.904332_15_plen_70_part_00
MVVVGTHSDKCSQQQGAEAAVSAEEVAAFCLAAQEKLGTYPHTSMSVVLVLSQKIVGSPETGSGLYIDR